MTCSAGRLGGGGWAMPFPTTSRLPGAGRFVVASRSLMRPFRLVVAASLSASFALFAPKIALAGSCDNPKSGACINSDTLWPHVGPSHFVSIGGTETIEAGKIGFGVIGDYQSGPIRLQTPSPGPLGTTQNAVNDQVNATFAFEYGITKNLELGVMLPLTLGQGGSGTSAITGGEDIREEGICEEDCRKGRRWSGKKARQESRVCQEGACQEDIGAQTGGAQRIAEPHPGLAG